MQQPLKFISVGYGYILCANRVWSIMRVGGSRTSKRTQSEAKKTGRYLDYTFGHKARTLVLLDNGFVIGCVFSPQVLYNRLNAAVTPQSSRNGTNPADTRDLRARDTGEQIDDEEMRVIKDDLRAFKPQITFLEDELSEEEIEKELSEEAEEEEEEEEDDDEDR